MGRLIVGNDLSREQLPPQSYSYCELLEKGGLVISSTQHEITKPLT